MSVTLHYRRPGALGTSRLELRNSSLISIIPVYPFTDCVVGPNTIAFVRVRYGQREPRRQVGGIEFYRAPQGLESFMLSFILLLLDAQFEPS